MARGTVRTPDDAAGWGIRRALVDGTLSHLVSVQPRPFSAMTYARLDAPPRGSLSHPWGPRWAQGAFIAKLREQCGDFRRSALVEQIVVKRGKAIEVVLAGRGSAWL